MPIDIARTEVQRLLANGAQLVEVLPAQEYANEHLPGAISVPLENIRNATQILTKERKVIVYCQNVE